MSSMTSMHDDIVPGALVQHPTFEDYGVVIRVNDGIVHVHFDDNETRSFAEAKSLSRVEFGDQVKQLSTGKIGLKLQKTGENPPKWKVAFGIEDLPIEIQEGDLRPDLSLDPFERTLSGQLPGEIDEVLITTSTHYLKNEHLNNDLVSLDGARVDLQPHQVSVVHRVVSNRPHRFLLCDEVGLGKTIEAGMVIKELRARGEAKRVLVIAPATLTRQWQFELKSKFNEVFPILNSDTVRWVASESRDENPFARYEGVIVSKDWISQPDRASLVTQAAWDLVIVDEAHHARRHSNKRQTRLYNVVKDLTDIVNYPDRAVLLLTATPMQLSSHELYSLVEMIDPALFTSEEGFNGHRNALPQLNELASTIDKSEDLNDLPAATANLLSTWLEISLEDARRLLSDGNKEAILEQLGKKHLLTEVLIRNRKAKVLGFKERRAHRWDVELTTKEKEVISAIEDYVEDGYRNASSSSLNSIGFLMTTYQKMTASSLRTIRDSLYRRLIRLQGGLIIEDTSEEELKPLLEDLNEDPAETHIVGEHTSQGAIQTELTQIKSIIDMLDEIKVDSKAEVLLANMEELAKSEVPKVLIFTEYRGTQDYLAGLLSNAGWSVNLFHGSQTPQKKDDSVEAFRTGEGRQVLIATEAGAEGRNFQFCHMLINYDLPWNPMTVEQRIGRIDRIGQENTVMVFNFCVKGSIEERVLDVLERRINLFEATVGGLDPILGDVAGDLRDIMQKAREDRPAAIDDLGKRLEAQVEEARKADARLQDLFMDTKSYSVSIAERIKGQQGLINAAIQEDFTKRLLKVHNTYIRRDEELREYEIHFHDPFLRRHPELFRHQEDRNRRAVFRSDERPGSELVQYLAFGHPVVEAAMSDVMQPKWPGAVGARRLRSGSDLQQVNVWLLIYEIQVSDVRPRTIFVPAFVEDGGVCDVEAGEKIVLRTLSDIQEERGQIDTNAMDTLRAARTIADEFVVNVMSQTIDQLQNSAAEKVERESIRLTKYYEKLKQNCQERIQATRDTLQRFEESDDEGQRRVIPMWQKRLTDLDARISELQVEMTRRLAQIGALQNPSCTPRLLQVSRIEVIGEENKQN